MRIILVLIAFVASLSILVGCKSSQKLKLQIPATNDVELKKGETESGYWIESLDVETLRRQANGSYIVAYTVTGYIRNEDPDKHYTLQKIQIAELDRTGGTDTGDHDRLVILTPILKQHIGKGEREAFFNFTNEHLVDYFVQPIKKVEFSCEDYNFLLELPQVIDKKQ